MSRNKIQKIAIKGAYGENNFGDDALMIAAIALVKKVFNPIEIFVIGRKADYISKYISPDIKVIEESELDNIDLVIYGGGTQHYSFPLFSNIKFDPKSLINYASKSIIGRYIKLFVKDILRIKSLENKIKTASVGMGIGPFLTKNTNEIIAKKAYSQMIFTAVRDQESLNILKKWNIKNAMLGTDLCYMPELFSTKESCTKHLIVKTFKKIGVIIRDWPHTKEGDEYYTHLIEVVRHLRENGDKVSFITFAPTYDMVWLKRLQDLGESVVSWKPGNLSINDFIKNLSQYDMFITARYHGAVFASILRKPVICIDVEQKLRMASELLAEGARIWKYPFASSDCIDLVADINKNYTIAKTALDRVVHSQHLLYEEMIMRLSEKVMEINNK